MALPVMGADPGVLRVSARMVVPCQINRPGRYPLTWAGLFDCQTIKLPVAVQLGLRSYWSGLLAS